jgi:hypothetical protein
VSEQATPRYGDSQQPYMSRMQALSAHDAVAPQLAGSDRERAEEQQPQEHRLECTRDRRARAQGAVESNSGPPSTHVLPWPWSCGTHTVTLPLHVAPARSVATKPI